MGNSTSAVCLAMFLAACGESSNGDGSSTAAGGSGGVGCEPAPKQVAPGVRLTDDSASGGGACSGTTVSAFIAKIHAAHPELADIVNLEPPTPTGDGSLVYPYRTPAGDFAFALKRGAGDCPAGCTENEYWYFESGANCAPVDAGHFHPTWDAGCLNVVGEARWGHPAQPDPATICGADLTPEDLSGTKQLWACGARTLCAAKGVAEEQTLAASITAVVAQDGSDPTTGTVTFSSTGYPGIDDKPLPATFLRRRFSVLFSEDNLPSACPHRLDVTADFDWEGFGPSSMVVDEVITPDCNVPDDYCKGRLYATLFAEKP